MQSGGRDPGVGGVEGLGDARPGQPADRDPAGTAGRLDHQRARRRHARAARGDAVGDLAPARPVRGGAERHGRGGPRPGSGRPGSRGRAHVREVRAAELAAALPQRPAPGGRGGRDRPGEGAPRPGGPGVDGPQRAGPGAVATRRGRPRASRSHRHDPARAGATAGAGTPAGPAVSARSRGAGPRLRLRSAGDLCTSRLRSDAWFTGDDEVAHGPPGRLRLGRPGGQPAGRQAGDRDRELGERAEPLQPAAARAGRGGAQRRARGGRRSRPSSARSRSART